MRQRDLTGSPAARAVALVAVAALAAVVVVLSVLALQRDRSAQVSPDAPRPAPTFTLGVSSPGPAPSASAPAAPSPSAAVASPGAAERLLALASEGTLWRATAGACGTVEPLVERSTDGGSTWTDVTPRYRGIGQVRSLSGLAGTEAEMIADMAECETQWMRTFTQGRFWEPYPDLLASGTYLSPDDASVMITPDGAVDAPCATPWGLHAGTAQSTLICEGTAHRRTAGSSGWTALAPTGVVAVDVTGGESVIVHADAATCATGTAVSRVAADGATIGAACVDGADLGAPIAVAALGDEVFVWHGDTVTPVALPTTGR